MKKNTTTKTPAKSGRPRKAMPSADEIPDVALSHAAAQKLWGIPGSELTRARREGCQAFRGNRIYRDPLLAWLKENPRPEITGDADTEDALKNRKLKAIVETLELKLAKERDELVPKSLVAEEWARGVAIVQEEAKTLMERDHYAVFITRIKARIRHYSEEQPPTTH
ncbi:MAG: hypothetical protein ABI600_21285 [Luteolibacter sp.]